jgi:hypothetical protein
MMRIPGVNPGAGKGEKKKASICCNLAQWQEWECWIRAYKNLSASHVGLLSCNEVSGPPRAVYPTEREG